MPIILQVAFCVNSIVLEIAIWGSHVKAQRTRERHQEAEKQMHMILSFAAVSKLPDT